MINSKKLQNCIIYNSYIKNTGECFFELKNEITISIKNNALFINNSKNLLINNVSMGLIFYGSSNRSISSLKYPNYLIYIIVGTPCILVIILVLITIYFICFEKNKKRIKDFDKCNNKYLDELTSKDLEVILEHKLYIALKM